MSKMDPSVVFGSRLPLAQAYHDSLATDGSTRGFIGPREVPRLWDRHIINCAVVKQAIPEGATVIDVGSGAGLPGIPLAIARPDLHITLIEPLLKRYNYLNEVVEELGLDNVTVLRGRAEEGPIKKAVAGADVVTSRAVAPSPARTCTRKASTSSTASMPFSRPIPDFPKPPKGMFGATTR